MEFPSHVSAGAAQSSPRWRLPRLSVTLKRFRRDESGSHALEFGLVAIPFFALLFAIIETAFSFWAGQILDATMQDASRLVLTGQAQSGTAITDLATFKSVAVCPKLPAFLDCANVKVDVRSAASFATVPPFTPDAAGNYDTSTFGYQKTNAGDIVVVRAVYPFPIYTSFLGIPGTVSLTDHKRMLISVATFRNEPF
jgi:Flp pilus assembly protein TadG